MERWLQLVGSWQWAMAETPPTVSLEKKLARFEGIHRWPESVGALVEPILVLLRFRREEAEIHDLESHLRDCARPPEEMRLRATELRDVCDGTERRQRWVDLLEMILASPEMASRPPSEREHFAEVLARRRNQLRGLY